ncbi:MAG: M20 family metallo-hydrolase [Firmicutes bacterium]|nr:M20 family metallo-hydrolase [Bacillota bacterium]
MLTNLLRIKKDIENLSEFNETPENGLTRFSLTESDKKARNYLKNELKKHNLKVYEDAAGNLFGKMESEIKNKPSIIIGSHFDSVKNGGNFDGPAGVIMALEIMRVLKEENVKLEYPIEFVAMIEEEGGRFGSGLFGSRAMVGDVSYKDLLKNKDESGISMAKAFEDFGFNPKDIKKAKRNPKDILAFIELHIEQGPVLKNENKDVGIVKSIVGINELKVTIKGRADHAGTTPMNMRKDALLASSLIISKINDFALSRENTVATVGSIKALPNAFNIVSEKVEFSVDIRSSNLESINFVKENITKELRLLEKDLGISWNIENLIDVKPTNLSEKILNTFINNANKNNFSYKKMISGAGHDAMVMANITDVGLIFVPSKDGKSHSCLEWTDYEDLQKGIELIYHTILEMGEINDKG